MGCTASSNKSIQNFDDSVLKYSEKSSITTEIKPEKELEQKDEKESRDQSPSIVNGKEPINMALSNEETGKHTIQDNTDVLQKLWDISRDENFLRNGHEKSIKQFENALIKTHEMENDVENGRDSEEKDIRMTEFYNALANVGAITRICDFIAEVFKEMRMNKVNDLFSEPKYLLVLNCLPKALRILVNFSDKSEDGGEVIREHQSFLPCAFSQLKTWRKMIVVDEFTEYDQILLSRIVILIFNMTLHSDNIEDITDLRGVEILIPYLKISSDLRLTLTVLAALANLVEDAESDVLQAEFPVIEYLIVQLEESLRDTYHESQGWSVAELAKIVRRISKSPYNRRALVKQGVLFPLANMAENGRTRETKEAVLTLWTLSFDDRNAKDMIDDSSCGVIDTVLKLRSSKEAMIKNTCKSMILNMRGPLQQSNKYRDIVNEIFRKKSDGATPSDESDGEVNTRSGGSSPSSQATNSTDNI